MDGGKCFIKSFELIYAKLLKAKKEEHVIVIIIYELFFGKIITNEKRISATLSPIKVSECRIEAVIKNISK